MGWLVNSKGRTRGPIAALLLSGCAAAFGQTDGFPEQLKAGCKTEEDCQRLVTQAQARQARCQDNTMGYIRCSDAHADAVIASSLLQEKVTARQKLEYDADQKRRDEQYEQVKRDKLAQIQRIQEQTNERERQHAEDVAARQKATDDQQAEQKEREEKSAAEVHERLRLLGRAGRATELRECYQEHQTYCSELLLGLMDVAEDDPEKQALVMLDQQLRVARTQGVVSRTQTSSPARPASRAQPAPNTSGEDSPLLCNDGELSPTCTCHGNHRGCCSHHGGISGCSSQ